MEGGIKGNKKIYESGRKRCATLNESTLRWRIF
jgi:hypothetical protein